MQLDARLRAVADFVPKGSRVADVGTDHGHLAIALVQEGVAPFAIASDKNEGPLEAARRAVYEAGLAERISLRLSDGLAKVAAGEVDAAILAGMGGALMAAILSASPAVVERLSTLVLQPQGAAAVEFRRADARQRLVPHSRVGPGQEQAERRQHDQQVHADAARPQPVCRGCAAVPALLPDVERADGPGRQHPHKVRCRRAVCVDGRRGAV